MVMSFTKIGNTQKEQMMGTCAYMLSFKCLWRYLLGLWLFVYGVVWAWDKDSRGMKEHMVAEIWILNETVRKKGLGWNHGEHQYLRGQRQSQCKWKRRTYCSKHRKKCYKAFCFLLWCLSFDIMVAFICYLMSFQYRKIKTLNY